MKKRTYKSIERGLFVVLALVTFLLVLTPMLVSSSDILIIKNIFNAPNKIRDEDFHLFCLATLSDKCYANGLEMTPKYQNNNYDISTQPV
jgi:hypothetical protein